MKTFKTFLTALLVTSAIDITLTRIAFAQQAAAGQLEEVVVTASKTGAESVQKTPIAVTAYTADQILQQHIGNVKDLAASTPSLEVNQTNANAVIYIRGIGSSNTNAGSDPDVTVQVDGVYIARPSGQFADLADVERIEVLRGPQGTLYGRNAVGGTINVISRQPSDTFHALADVSTGSYNLIQTRDYITGPITDNVQAMLALNYLYHDPYIKNIAPGGNDLDNANRGSVRGQLRYEPTSNIDATTRLDWSAGYENFESFDHVLVKTVSPATLANSLIGNYSEVAVKSPQWEEFHSGGIAEEVNYHVTDYLNLKSLSAWRKNYYRLHGTADGTELNIAFINASESQSQASEEITAELTLDRLRAVMGVYYLEEDIDAFTAATNRTVTPASAPHVYDDSKAIYGQATYSLTSNLRLTGGARFTSEDKTIHMHSTLATTLTAPSVPTFTAVESSQYSAFTPKAVIEYDVFANGMVYGSVTKGYKSGGFSNAATTLATLAFGPEKLWSYEVGAKTDWLNKKLRVNLTGFWYNYNGLQVTSNLSPGVTFTGNANTATVKGAELEIKVKPLPDVTLASNTSLLSANYGNFTNAAVSAGVLPFVQGSSRYNPVTTRYDASGNVLNDAPRYSGSESIQYDRHVGEGSAYGRVEYSWQTATYFDPSNVAALSAPAYGLVNLALGYTPSDGALNFQLSAKNLADKKYLIGVLGNGNVLGRAGPPRTIMFTVSRQW